MPGELIGERLGAWRIEARLGKGGMGEVFRAVLEDGPEPRAVAALKVLHGSFDPDDPELTRFRREGAILAELNHPGIVRALGPLTVEPTRAWYPMELVSGRDLARLLREERRLAPASATALAGEVLDALEHAHARGVIHRDVKPSNVLLDPQGRARLVDFGLARVAGRSGLTRTGTVLGTPEYMAPEQAQGQEAGAPADLYALGVTLWTMLAGRPPFEAESPLAVLRQQVERPPPPLPSGLLLPAGLEGVIRRALAKDPAARWPSAGDMARALRALPAEPAAPPEVDPQGSTRDLSPLAGTPEAWAASTRSWSPPAAQASPGPSAPVPTPPAPAVPDAVPPVSPAPPAPPRPGALLLLAGAPLVITAALALLAARQAPPAALPALPAPVASSPPAPRPEAPRRVEVRLRGGVVLSGELVELDPGAGQVVVRDLSGRVQQLDLSQVEGLTYLGE